jgi:hypothetical protein
LEVKKALRITAIVLGIILLIVLGAVVAIQHPKVQGALARKALERFQDKFDGTFEFEELSVKPFDAVVLRNVVLLDNSPLPGSGADTLAKIGFLSAKFSIGGLLHGDAFYLDKALIKDGEFNLVTEPGSDGKKSTTNVERVFRIKSSGKSNNDWGNLLHARKVEIENFRYTMKLMNDGTFKRSTGSHINFNDLDLIANISVRNLDVKGGYVKAEVKHLDMKEKSGFWLKNASAKVKVGKEAALIDNLVLQDGESDLHLNYLRFLGKIKDYSDFIHSIRIQADIAAPSVFAMSTVSHFGPNMERLTFRSDLKGRFDGTVDNFKVSDIDFHELNSNTSGIINGGMTGLPDINRSVLDYDIKGLSFNMTGLEKFIQTWAPGVRLNLGKIAQKETFRFNGSVYGPLDNMAIKGDATCQAGKASADLKITDVLDQRAPIGIAGTLDTDNLDIGRIVGADAIHGLTAKADVNATLGKPLTADFKVQASRLHILDYNYSDIKLTGTYDGKSMDCNLVSSDPNLKMFMNGGLSSSERTGNTVYKADLYLAKADLHALGIDKREDSAMKGEIHANITQTSSKDLLGEISLVKFNIFDKTGWHNLGNVNISAYNNVDQQKHRFNFTSGFANGNYMGSESILKFIEDIQEQTVRKELSAVADRGATSLSAGDYELNFNVRDASVITEFLAPGVSIADGTSVKLKTTREGQLYCLARSGRISFGSNTIRNLVVDVDNMSGGLSGSIKASQLKLGGIDLRANNCKLQAKDNNVYMNYTFAGAQGSDTRGEVVMTGNVTKDEQEGTVISATVLPSVFSFKGEDWRITSDLITYGADGVKVRKLNAISQLQTINVDGGYSSTHSDTLQVSLNRFDVSLLNHFLMNGKLALDGRASGTAKVLSGKEGFAGLTALLTAEDAMIAGNRAGDIHLSSAWNSAHKRFDVNLYNNLDGMSSIEADGNYVPSSKELLANLNLSKFNLSFFAPVLESVFSEFAGDLSGKIQASGTLDDIHLKSKNTYLEKGRMTVAFTNVPYKVEGPVSVTDEGLMFEDLSVKDSGSGTGTIGGGILFGGFKNVRLDTHLKLNRIKALGIKAGQNDSFFGDISATGKVDITGPLSDILLDIDGTTTGNGNLHIPLSNSSSDKAGSLLTFTSGDDDDLDYDDNDIMEESSASPKSGKSELTVKLRARATPDVEAWIDIGENTLTGVGSGIIDIESRSSDGAFLINGDYTLSSGNFHFSAMNLVSRDFALEDGSTIRFNGDIMNSDLNINGLYSTKTTLSNLLADSTSTRRTVNCGIHITEKLRNPKIDLSIDVPDLDPTTQAMVQAALNTPDKVQKQFLYLLIANTFLPSEESGITTGGSSMLFSNMTSIMSGQLNNILQKLEIPLDLGLNYQPNERGNDLLDVALSTQLFNNRVIVNGTIGSRRGTGTGAAYGDVTGDLDVEIKINKDGSLRAKLFSHSADAYTNYLDNSQRNGAGITYQREFRTFGQFLRDLFSTREQLRERQLEEQQDTSSHSVRIDTTGHAIPLK